MRTHKPELRITKWLTEIQTTGPGIPLEAECTACADAQFKIKYDKRSDSAFHNGTRPFGPPDGESYWRVLQCELEEHLKKVHSGNE